MIRFIDLLLYVLAAGFIYLFYVILHQYTFWRRRKVPFIDTAPIIGNSLPVARKKISAFDHFKGLHLNHSTSRYYGLHDFNCPALLIRDPDLIRDICIKAFDHFPNHRQFFSNAGDPILSKNLIALKDQEWRNMRNILSPSFTAAKMKLMFGLIDDCAREFTQSLKDNPDLAKKIEAKDSFTKFTCDSIASAAFGIKVNTMKNPENEFYKAGMEVTNVNFWKFYKILLVNALPFLKNVVDGGFLSRKTSKFFNELIEHTIKVRKEEGIVRPDMIQLMIEAGSKVTTDDIIGNCFVFFLGGFDTSSNLMCLVAYELAGNPEVQEKLRREIDDYFASKPEDWDQKISYDDVNKLKYLDMILNETLRFYPPALVTERICSQEYQLPEPLDGYGAYKIEKGVMVIMSMVGVHHDPKYFTDPEKFDPERFSEKRKQEINPYTYFPFGLGPRKCIADRFALMETKILFVHLIRNFELKLAGETKYPIVFDKTKLAMRPENGFLISLEARKKLD